MDVILTQYTGKFIGPVAKLLGYLMNWIYEFTCLIFPESTALHGNIGLCIILFTLIIYLALLPLTIKQQKFSKLSQKMQPEIQEVQKKYKNKKDQASMMAMNQETQAIYAKYGISPTGSCLQLIIQMPILFALYRVIYNIPAYVGGFKEYFGETVRGIMATDGYQDIMTKFVEGMNLRMVSLNLEGTQEQAANSIIDVLYAMPTTAWDTLKDTFRGLSDVITTLEGHLEQANYFLGINIANSPSELIKSGWSVGQYLLVFGAILVPVLSALTQFLNVKLMPTAETSNANNGNGQANSMANSMKVMNYMMPIMSFIFVFSLPVGMGIYWIAGAVIRCIQQIIINKHMDKIDLDKIIEKNQEKAKKKKKKKGIMDNQISNMARMNTRSMSDKANIGEKNKSKSDVKIEESSTASSRTYKEGSMAAKANLVRDFNERNNKQ